jgi:hypothetical protein
MRIERAFFDERQTVDGDGQAKSASLPYFVFDAQGKTVEDVLAAVREVAPAKLNGLYLASVEIDERVSDDTYAVTVTYERDEAKAREETTTQGEEGDTTEYGNASPAVSFDTTGGTRRVTQSLATVRYPANAADYGGAIAVDGEGNINGVDITMPVMRFTETHYFKPARVTTVFQKRLFTLTGKVNNSAFREFAAGEVLFTGVSARRTGTGADDLWELTFNFSVSPNNAQFSVQGMNGTINKPGWDYAWISYGETVRTGRVRKVPVAVYVEQVYERADFSLLGINTEAIVDE